MTDYYKPTPVDSKYILVGYSCNDNKYTVLYYSNTEELALNEISEIEINYSYDYYCLYKDNEYTKKVYGSNFSVYGYKRLIASKRCSYKNLPIPLNNMLIGMHVDDDIIGGGRWVLFQ